MDQHYDLYLLLSVVSAFALFSYGLVHRNWFVQPHIEIQWCRLKSYVDSFIVSLDGFRLKVGSKLSACAHPYFNQIQLKPMVSHCEINKCTLLLLIKVNGVDLVHGMGNVCLPLFCVQLNFVMYASIRSSMIHCIRHKWKCLAPYCL